MTASAALRSLLLSSFIALSACSTSSKSKAQPDSLDQAIEAKRAQFEACHQSALKQDGMNPPAQSGEVEASISLNPKGKVIEASVIRSTMGSKKLEDCVVQVFRRMELPKDTQGRITQTTRVIRFGQATD